MDPKSPWYSTEIGAAYHLLWKYLVSDTQEASFILLPTTFNPTENVTKFVRRARLVLENCTARGSYTYHLAGEMCMIEDAISKVLDVFPWMMGVIGAVITLFLLVVYRTAVLSFRTLLTIALTLASSFGLGAMLFVMGWFNWLANIIASFDSFYWFTPICTFVIICGLSLDYDLFLYTRIFENRAKGMSTKRSVAEAVEKAGAVITYAGIIMSIAFGGLMLSSIVTIVQIGFMLLTSVLIDTFLVRTFFVPPIIHLLGEANWWPRRFPKEKEEAESDTERTRLIDGSVNFSTTSI
jgi:uncharacterized membrane protein YdfJ with MMPL/SSD domain